MSAPCDKDKKSSKKKMPRSVPSRYMQAAANVTKCSSRGSSPSSSSRLVTGADSSLNFTNLSIALHNDKRYDLMSTPASSLGGEAQIPYLDESSIRPENPISILPPLASTGVKLKTRANKSVPKTSQAKCAQGQTKLVSAMPHISNVRKDRQTDKACQREIDIMYAKYIQMCYLQYKSMACAEKKTHLAMIELHKLWAENQILMEKVHQSKVTLFLAQSLDVILDSYDKLQSILEPTLEHVSRLKNQFREIKDAVDNIRHQLPTSKICLPVQTEAETLALLPKCRYMLHEAIALIREKYADIPEIGDLLTKWVAMSKNLCKELDSQICLVPEVDTLAVTAACLKL